MRACTLFFCVLAISSSISLILQQSNMYEACVKVAVSRLEVWKRNSLLLQDPHGDLERELLTLRNSPKLACDTGGLL